MKQTIKYLILALLIPAAYCFTACDTDIEPIDQQIIKPDQQDPAQYAAYLAALKAYKASEHYVVYASLANAPAVPGSEKAFLRSLPDSLDIVALENAGNLTEYDIEDIPPGAGQGHENPLYRRLQHTRGIYGRRSAGDISRQGDRGRKPV